MPLAQQLIAVLYCAIMLLFHHPKCGTSGPQAVNKVVCSPDSALMYTACLDGLLRCWDIRTGVQGSVQ